ncbi:MAG: hypothetical protein JNN15_07830 [Blastocatellia bacterium]|nr:hypothetical protein [Blastocatellia bacterium]
MEVVISVVAAVILIWVGFKVVKFLVKVVIWGLALAVLITGLLYYNSIWPFSPAQKKVPVKTQKLKRSVEKPS